ncbi:MAG: GumC family protein [Gemmatimonadales bacterium]
MDHDDIEVGRIVPVTRAQVARPAAASPTVGGGLEAEVRVYVDIVRRRFGWIKWTFVVIVAAALAYTAMQEPEYRATALVELNGGDADVPSLDALLDESEPSEEDLRTHLELLRSASLATQVIEDLRLDTISGFLGDAEALPHQRAAALLEKLIVDPVEESRLVQISFDGPTPELAAAVVNGVVEAYAGRGAEARRQIALTLAEQVDSVEARLQKSEEDLLEFAVVTGFPYLVEEDVTAQVSTRMSDLRTRLTDAQSARFESQALRDVVGGGGVSVVQDEVLNGLLGQLSDLRAEYARLSATFTDDYPETAEVRRQIEQVRGLIEEEQQRLAGRVESEYQLAVARENALANAIAEEQESATDRGPDAGRYYVLRQAIMANRTLLADLSGRRREAEVAAAIASTDFAVVDRAVPPLEPHRPVFMINMALAVMLALVLGVAAAFGRELMDGTIRSAEDLSLADRLPVLALIPSFAYAGGGRRGSLGGSNGHLLLPRRGTSTNGRKWIAPRGEWPRIDASDGANAGGRALADSFGSLRASVLFEEGKPAPRSVLVTSCRPGEGKTTVAVNLAMSTAKLGKRVLLIDADMRKPAVHRAFRINPGPGLASCLAGEANWLSVRRHSGVEDVHLLPAGEPTPGAADLLSGERLGLLLREAEEIYDLVIVDAPALFINASDAKLLAREVSGVIVVLRSRFTPKALVDRIPATIPNVMGLVVNDLLTTSMPDYFGNYFTEYGNVPEPQRT